jgi:deoxyribodipyrimidine photo-lyase
VPADTSLLWFRRDLRPGDHPALLAAADAARRAFLAGCLRSLSDSLGGRLLVRRGDPAEVVADTARRIGARTVHVSADFAPYGRGRDQWVAAALVADGAELVRTGSPYAVAPGRVRKPDGQPYRVFTPFQRAWLAHGWRAPARGGADSVRWLEPPSGLTSEQPEGLAAELGRGERWPSALPEPGEAAAPTCSGTTRAPPGTTRTAGSTRSPGTTMRGPSGCSPRGGTGAPDIRSWTPGCASCAPRAGCTTGCG